jgi:hypothetical protein
MKQLEWKALVLYIVAAGIILTFHEMWRDELEVWLVARDHALLPMLMGLSNNAHPPLWYLLVKGIQLVTANPAGMQILHLLIAAAVAALVLFRAPFPLFQRILIVFGYFFIYEYAVISRNYSLALLFIFILCILLTRPRRNYPLIGAALLLLSLTHVLGSLVALAFAVYILVDLPQGERAGPAVAAVLLALLLGMGIYYLLDRPPSPGELASRLLQLGHRPLIFRLLWHSYVPVPPLQMGFWNHNIVQSGVICAILSAGLLAASLYFFRQTAAVLCFLLVSGGLLLLFFNQILPGSLRHHGFFFITLLAAWWLTADRISPASLRGFMTGLLVLHCLAGVIACYFEIRYPFSASGQACRYIKKNKLDSTAILAGDPDYVMQAASAWLGRPLYYPVIGEFGSHVLWNKPARLQNIALRKENRAAYKESMVRQVKTLAAEMHRPVLFMANYRTPLPLVAAFTAVIEPEERCFLYFIPADSTR